MGEVFTYHIFGRPGELKRWQEDSDSFSLAITGMVDSPVKLSLRQIPGMVSVCHVLCAGAPGRVVASGWGARR